MNSVLEASAGINPPVAQLPLQFLDGLARAKTLNDVLQCTSYWVMQTFQADRASVALRYDDDFLQLYALTGNQVIPLDRMIPIEGTFVGSVFTQQTVAINNDHRSSALLDCQWLEEGGLLSSMDAPLICDANCYGTLNLAHRRLDAFSESDAKVLASLAAWVGAQIHNTKRLDELERLVRVDPLTGALNRRAFVEATREIGSKPRHYDHQTALLMIDLDNFKTINDQYGHPAGDQVLVEVSDTLKNSLRSDDLFARYGGEEFALLLRHADQGEAARIADMLREKIERLSLRYRGADIRTTISVGLTVPHADDRSFEDVVCRADDALYRAKQQGRNRIVYLSASTDDSRF